VQPSSTKYTLPAQQTNIACSTAAVVSFGDVLVELILAAKNTTAY